MYFVYKIYFICPFWIFNLMKQFVAYQVKYATNCFFLVIVGSKYEITLTALPIEYSVIWLSTGIFIFSSICCNCL